MGGGFQHLLETSMLCTNYSCHLIKLHPSWGWMWLYAGPEVSVAPGEDSRLQVRRCAIATSPAAIMHVWSGWVLPY